MDPYYGMRTPTYSNTVQYNCTIDVGTRIAFYVQYLVTFGNNNITNKPSPKGTPNTAVNTIDVRTSTSLLYYL